MTSETNMKEAERILKAHGVDPETDAGHACDVAALTEAIAEALDKAYADGQDDEKMMRMLKDAGVLR